MKKIVMMNSDYHQTVLLHAAVDALDIKPNGVYVDLTFGGGGHTQLILEKLGDKGKLFAFDRDPDAKKNLPDDKRLTFVAQDFRYMQNYLKLHGAKQVDGILADLGVSSFQFDTAERGFSIRFDGPLDMRMDKSSPLSAKEVVNDYDFDELTRVFKLYGELRSARKLASHLIKVRDDNAILTTTQLIDELKGFFPERKQNKFMAMVFQALRIEVNGELESLTKMLEQAVEVLKPEGRLVVISYHSLEDRLVKNMMKRGSIDGEEEKDFFGKSLRPFDTINSKPIVPNEDEIQNNSRARSAKMRVAVRRKDD